LVVKELRALTSDELTLAASRFRNPAPGGRIEAAKKFGVDLTLLIEQLRLEPGERVRRLHDLAQTAERVRGTVRRK
jgi:hypothetical protein